MLGKRCAWPFLSGRVVNVCVWQALRLSDPQKQGYILRWPILGSRFNMRDYQSVAMIIDDIETILETTLQDSLSISRQAYKVFFLSSHGLSCIFNNI